MKTFLSSSTSLCIALFMISCSTVTTSHTDKVELPAEETIDASLNSVDVYNNFLKSLECGTTPGVEEYKYPDYYGGCYTNNKGICIFQVLSGYGTEDVLKDLKTRSKSNNFSIEECAYSYSDLEAVLSYIKTKLFDRNFDSTRESLKWHGCYLNTEKNRVMVRLGECTDEYITKFKAAVSDSPMIEFIEGGKNVIM